MSQRLCGFLVVLLLLFQEEIFGQEKERIDTVELITWDCLGSSHNCNPNPPARRVFLYIKPGDCIKLPLNYETLKNFDFENQLQLDYRHKDSITNKKTPFPAILFKQAISPSLYTSQLGFFCKKELQLEKITATPFRFRLGSLDYVDYLEHKR